MKENREYKDSVFIDLFYGCSHAAENQLSLYNALHDTNYTADQLELKDIRIEQVLYMNFRNDMAFLANGRVCIFGEHQSTINENMPLRDLLYFARSYEKLMDTSLRYRRNRIEIPAPEFFVFYNGTDNYPVESELKLSDSFTDKGTDDKIWAELTVKVININLDKHHPILDKCPVLKEYMLFVERVRTYTANGETNPVTKAVTECIREGIFADYLRERGSEVENMLIAEYDYETDIAVHELEAEERGIIIGEKRGEKRGIRIGEERGKYVSQIAQIRKKLQKQKSLEQIADEIEEDVEYVSKIAALIQQHPDSTDIEIYQSYTSDTTK